MAEIQVPREFEALIAMKEEVAAGTDVFGGSYTSEDVIPTRAGTLRFNQDPNEIQNLMTSGRLGRAPSLLGPLTGSISFSMYPRGRGVAYAESPLLVPEWDRPLIGCRTEREIDDTPGAEAVHYTPAEFDTTQTVWLVIKIPGGDALAIKLAGAIGNMRSVAVAGGQMSWDFTFVGSLSRGDVAYVSGDLVVTPQYPTLKSAQFQVDGYEPCVANIGFDLGNVPGVQPCANAASGVVGHFTADRNPRFTIDPDADREASSGWWQALSTGAPMKDISYRLDGGVDYNRITFQAGGATSPGATAQVVAQGLLARGGIMALPTTILATLDPTDPDWRISAIK